MSDEPIYVLLHPAIRQRFEAWLAQTGLCLSRIPFEHSGIPEFVVGISDPRPEALQPFIEPPSD